MAWLLLLAGPLGWIGLLLVAATRRSAETLTVTLPYCEATDLRMKRAVRVRQGAVLVFLGTFVAAFLALLPQTTDFRLLAAGLGAIAIAALIQVIVESVRSNRAMVRIDLDVSRRWVTLWGVHPNFLAAVPREGHGSFAAPTA